MEIYDIFSCNDRMSRENLIFFFWFVTIFVRNFSIMAHELNILESESKKKKAFEKVKSMFLFIFILKNRLEFYLDVNSFHKEFYLCKYL